MSEYKIQVTVNVPGFLRGQTMREIRVYEAETAAKAIAKAEQDIKYQLSDNGIDLDSDKFIVAITDIEKL